MCCSSASQLFIISIESASLNSFQFVVPRSRVGATTGDLTAKIEVSFETDKYNLTFYMLTITFHVGNI